MKRDVIDVIEAAYDVVAADDSWLSRLAEAARNQLGDCGVIHYRYHLRPHGGVSIPAVDGIGLNAVELELARASATALSNLPVTYVRETFIKHQCVRASRSGPAATRSFTRRAMEELFGPAGWKDLVVVNALDPTGAGIYLGFPVRAKARLPRSAREAWSRVAAHIAAANRLRRSLARAERAAPDTADAVLAPSGQLKHLNEDPAMLGARDVLRTAVRTIERARSARGRANPDEALDEWKGLVAARWSLVDHFESDGQRYILARRNESTVDRSACLSSREQQAVAYAALGHHNKLIAYEMGLASSTVGVLLHRAAKKLGASDRRTLLDAFARRAARARTDGAEASTTPER